MTETDRRMIFCLTTGRSGTAYLAEMMALLPGVCANHEPHPPFEVATRHALETGDQRMFWIQTKLADIREVQEEGYTYVETSHEFKYHARGLYELGVSADLIVLTRPAEHVAYSYWSRQHIPGRTPVGLRYFAKPDDPYTVLPLSHWEDLTDYQLCYWYCLETHLRIMALASMYREAGARVFETTLDKITQEAGFRDMLRELDLPAPDWDTYRAMRDQQINALNPNKRGPKPDRREELERQVALRALESVTLRWHNSSEKGGES